MCGESVRSQARCRPVGAFARCGSAVSQVVDAGDPAATECAPGQPFHVRPSSAAESSSTRASAMMITALQSTLLTAASRQARAAPSRSRQADTASESRAEPLPAARSTTLTDAIAPHRRFITAAELAPESRSLPRGDAHRAVASGTPCRRRRKAATRQAGEQNRDGRPGRGRTVSDAPHAAHESMPLRYALTAPTSGANL